MAEATGLLTLSARMPHSVAKEDAAVAADERSRIVWPSKGEAALKRTRHRAAVLVERDAQLRQERGRRHRPGREEGLDVHRLLVAVVDVPPTEDRGATRESAPQHARKKTTQAKQGRDAGVRGDPARGRVPGAQRDEGYARRRRRLAVGVVAPAPSPVTHVIEGGGETRSKVQTVSGPRKGT